MLGGREAVAAAAKEPQAVRVYHCNFGAKLRPCGQAERANAHEQVKRGNMHLVHSQGTADFVCILSSCISIECAYPILRSYRFDATFA